MIYRTPAVDEQPPTHSLWSPNAPDRISYKRIAKQYISQALLIAVVTHLIDSSVVGLHRRRVPVLLALGDADGEADDKGDGGYADRGYLYPFLFNHFNSSLER